jgi:zinc finger protein
LRVQIPSRCPQCNAEIQFQYQTEEIPYFSEIMLVTGSCECGFRSVDTLILKESEPVIWTMRVENTDDLCARVVRSNRGRMEIPEFGIVIDPGPSCEACITNIEGILEQVGEVIERVLTWAEGEERERALSLQRDLQLGREGCTPFTLVITDPSGNSAIISNKAIKTVLPEEEGHDSGP